MRLCGQRTDERKEAQELIWCLRATTPTHAPSLPPHETPRRGCVGRCRPSHRMIGCSTFPISMPTKLLFTRTFRTFPSKFSSDICVPIKSLNWNPDKAERKMIAREDWPHPLQEQRSFKTRISRVLCISHTHTHTCIYGQKTGTRFCRLAWLVSLDGRIWHRGSIQVFPSFRFSPLLTLMLL